MSDGVWVQVPSLAPERNDNFRQKIVVSFCSFLSSLFLLLFSLKLSFPDKREKRNDKRKGCFASQSIDLNNEL